MDSAKVIRLAKSAGDYLKDSRGREDFIFDYNGLIRFAALIQQSLIDEGWRSPEQVKKDSGH